ncbi:Electron transport complex subunit RsxB [Fundidesulfovibrio magnetotacticus]|uniref:Electron transport complex subunit RsxB n=1 Tax=Fundidesulfovibrio magnetotacticus TaxID=2730080 RepID=A0A6V8LWG3_9BACT|nr:4Fe-4S dicluster domain-containing protein [Fundidesulfovibrio magnetotacticus]GFK96074.1 Electron transport complex subunit RsxB [Fundidesulfovibrio magnetotacticus]
MKTTRKIVEIDEELCNGCGECLPNCAEGAISIVDGKARLKADKLCDGLGACLGHCPMGALKIIERVADEFDEDAVHHELETMKQAEAAPAPAMGCGCPGANVTTLKPHGGCPGSRAATLSPKAQPAHSHAPVESNLGHWPVKLRLVPADAPFLRGAEVIVAADCAPVALPDFHARMAGKVVLIACPKFDDPDPYIQKLAQMMRHSGVKKVQVLRMEVPCCTGLSHLVRQAAALAGNNVPVEDLVIARTGEVQAAQTPRTLF